MRTIRLSLLCAAAVAALATATASADYTPDPDSLKRHTAPQWFNDAKLGFFVHWGPYSVPAFANPKVTGNAAYAEWYWQHLNNPADPTQARHRELFGQDFPYDGFIEQWKAERFDPDSWLRLFEEGGGKYFVQVSKHHDGVALFDTETTDRSTVKLGPHRDFVSELFAAANRYDLKRGLYYSLPEWYHPLNDRPEYGFRNPFISGAPKNPFTSLPVPYTGYKEISSYVDDHQYPQMLEIIDRYDPDILWCDIGGPNRSNEVFARYFNQDKEVTVDNRCGNGISDFSTPEYRVEPDIRPYKWEATRGVGRSFGYNAEEGPEDYIAPNELIDSFVDVVSKNGNFLLNVGPKADGTIPDIQADRLRALGAWLNVNGEAIYGSTPWTQAADAGANVRLRFTTQPKAFYMTALDWPGERLVVSADVPLSAGNEIRLLGHRRPLRWQRDAAGNLVVDMPPRPSQDAFTFRIAQRGYDPARTPQLGVTAKADPGVAGRASKVAVTLANRGDRPIAGGRLTVRAPGGWSASPDSVRFGTLAPHTRQAIDVAVDVPADTSPGDYALDLEATVGRHVYTGGTKVDVPGALRPVDLEFDNDAISTPEHPTDGDFDGSGNTYPSEQLPAAGTVTFGHVPFAFPSSADGERNNLVTNGQSIALSAGKYRRLHVLASASSGPVEATARVTYADGSTQTVRLNVPNWLENTPDAPIRSLYRRTRTDPQEERVADIFRFAYDLDGAKEISSISIGKATGASASAALHVFALTLQE